MINRVLYLYYFVVVHRGPHGRLAFFFLLNVLPSENKDYYYYYFIIKRDQTVGLTRRSIRVSLYAQAFLFDS